MDRPQLSNVTQHPLTTVGGSLVGIGQYLVLHGATMPTDPAGWISFGIGLLIALSGALMQDPQIGGGGPSGGGPSGGGPSGGGLAAAAGVLLCLVLTGCALPKAGDPTAPTTAPAPASGATAPATVINPALQTAVNAGVPGVAMLGCSFIPPADRASALAALTAADAVASVDPKAALASLQTNPATSWIWYALGNQVNQVQNITDSQWMTLAQGALRSAIAGCANGMGVTSLSCAPPDRVARVAAVDTRWRGLGWR